jgi:predicted dehydrogenase
MNAAEAEQVAAAAKMANRHVVEAFHDRYHPMFAYLLARTRSHSLGTLVDVRAEVSVSSPFNAESFRHDPRLGGGALMEFGCYAVRWIRDVVGEEPQVVSAAALTNPIGGDSQVRATFAFPGGAVGEILADSLTEAPGIHSRIEVIGTRGRIVIENPIVPHAGHSIREWIGDKYHVRTIGGAASYDYQLDAVVRSIESGIPAATSATAFVPAMRVIDAIFASAGIQRGRP